MQAERGEEQPRRPTDPKPKMPPPPGPLLVAVGGGCGAACRLYAARAAARPGVPPAVGRYAITAVNIAGSLALGALTASPGLAPAARLALGTGFCGGFTTFSTFSVETVQLLERGRLGLAALHAALNVGGGVTACALGMLLAGAAKG